MTVTQGDVLYVSQQIKRDLMALSDCYPVIVSQRLVNELDLSIGTLLFNDAVTTVGFSIEDPHDGNLVYHELRYTVTYTGTGPRTGLGGGTITRVAVPARAQLTSWVHWSDTMRSLPPDKQRQIVQSTRWGIPGSATFQPRYAGTTHALRGIYASGPLAAKAEEFRR